MNTEKIICIIACHTNSKIKIKSLVNNIYYLNEISDEIIIINSNEFKDVLIEDTIKETYDHDLLNKIKFVYTENSKLLCQKKWYEYIKNFKKYNFDYFILTNDSFLITRSLLDFKNLFNKNTELVGIIDSYEIKYHYPDFLRCYNNIGIDKFIKLYDNLKNNTTLNGLFDNDDNKTNINNHDNYQLIVNNYEIDSTYIYRTKNTLFKCESDFLGNIHFDDCKLEEYLYIKNYPIIKIKKLQLTHYEDKNIPDDFDPLVYKSLHADLKYYDTVIAREHFKVCGLNEGRIYKRNQECNYLKYLKEYLNSINFVTIS
jgi:hypothetical protein